MLIRLKKPALIAAAFALLTPVAAMAQRRGQEGNRRSAPRIVERSHDRDHDRDRGRSRSHFEFRFGPSVRPRYYVAPSPYSYGYYSYDPYYTYTPYADGYYDQWGYWHPYGGYYDAWGVWHWGS